MADADPAPGPAQRRFLTFLVDDRLYALPAEQVAEGEDDRAAGPWDPKLDAETLRRMLRVMALTRAFDDRMYRAQRQGKTSFYMKCTGEEAVSIAAAFALADDDMVFPSYRQQGVLIARGYPLIEMMNQIYSNRADKLKGRQLPVMYSARDYGFFSISGNLTTQYPQAVGWAMASAIKGDTRIATAFIGEGSPQALQESDSPFVQQFLHGQPDGPVRFRYPAPGFAQQLQSGRDASRSGGGR